MSGRTGIVRCPDARIYDHGPGHPLRPERVLLTWSLMEAYGVFDAPGVLTLGCAAADDATLRLVHTSAFIDATRRAGHGEQGDWAPFGYGPGDNPVFDRMHEAGALVAGATVTAARAVRSGEVDHAFNATGGLHHAMPSRASGFCVYDDPAIGIAWLLHEGVERIAYVDVDVHHGDGPQAIFLDEPRVLTVSIHEYAPELGFFPGTGAAEERGGPQAPGSAINVPLPPGVTDDGWLAAFDMVVPDAVRRFRPEVLVTQLGCDTHRTDPLAHLRLTTSAYRSVARLLHELAHDAAGGRWVATGGGGYQWARVVPRAWTIDVGGMAGVELPDELPADWLAEVEAMAGPDLPRTLSEEPTVPGASDAEARRIAEEIRRWATASR